MDSHFTIQVRFSYSDSLGQVIRYKYGFLIKQLLKYIHFYSSMVHGNAMHACETQQHHSV